MKAWYRLLCVAILATVCWAEACVAQVNHDIANWLGKETLLHLNIDDVQGVYEDLLATGLLENDELDNAMKMLTGKEIPVVGSEFVNEVKEKISNLEKLLDSAEQLAFVMHDIEDARIVWSIFVRCKKGKRKELVGRIFALDQAVKSMLANRVSIPGSHEAQKDSHGQIENDNTHPEPDGSPVQLGWCECAVVRDWIVFSNNKSFLSEFPERLNDHEFRSLATTRKYRSATSHFGKSRRENPTITVFGNPEILSAYFKDAFRNNWELSLATEIPSFGVSIYFERLNAEAGPSILIDATINHTVPTTGFAKALEHYQPVELPKLAVRPIELTAYTRDEEQVFAEFEKTLDQQVQLDAPPLSGTWKRQLEEAGFDRDTGVRSYLSGLTYVRFEMEDGEEKKTGTISVGQVEDFDRAREFCDIVSAQCNGRLGRKLSSSMARGDAWWTIPKNQFAQNSGAMRGEVLWGTNFEFANFSHDAYVLNEETLIQGDMPAVKQQVDLIKRNKGEDFSREITSLSKELRGHFFVAEQPRLIKFFTERSWQENIDAIENRFAYDNRTEETFEIDAATLEELNKILGQQGEGQRSILMDDTGNQELLVETPLPLGERNEWGLRFLPINISDIVKAIELEVLRGISKSFSRQLILFFPEPGRVRILAGIYSEGLAQE